MRRYETPPAIASALARHAPRQMKRILDPAVGNGALLEPFSHRLESCEIFAVDTDSRPLRRVKTRFGSDSENVLNVIQANFLEWACAYRKRGQRLFDCIVVNPPFSARRNKWVSLSKLSEIVGPYSVPQAGPVEAGFVLAAVALLKPGGRLLAVLPASLVTAPCSSWVREFMAAHGAIRHVHELPRFTFPKIESRIYLVVYEKGSRHGKILLLNHDLLEPEKMLVEAKGEISRRLDFGYNNSICKLKLLKERRMLGWRPLGELAEIWRGTEATPGICKTVVHTGNYRDGFWRASNASCSRLDTGLPRAARTGDILVKRISRNCASSFGISDCVLCAPASDCVLVIRPRNGVSTARLLFALRCLMTLDFGPALLEKGTGASYLAQRELNQFEVPFSLSKQYPGHFRFYVRAIRRHCFASMLRVESEVSQKLLELQVANPRQVGVRKCQG